MPSRPALRRSTVVIALATLWTLAACGGEAPTPSTTATTSRPAAVSTPSATPGLSASTTTSAGSTLAGRTAAGLASVDAYASKGYPKGNDLPAPSGPATEVCAKVLDIDRLSTTHVASARIWTSQRFMVTQAVHGYQPGSANDAVTQVEAAAGSCTTYQWLGTTYTLAEPVATPQLYGIESAFTYCEQMGTGPIARCTLVFAHDALLGLLRVQAFSGSTSDAAAELFRLTHDATSAVQAA